MKPLVSILIPAYNAQDWVADTLRSAISQTWNRKEIIIVDDGSTDRTLEVVRMFESPSVRIFSQQNQGAAAARNKAFSLCQGDYIQWLDADDLLAPDKVATQMRILEECGNDRVLASGAWGSFLCRPKRAEFHPNGLWCDLSPTEWLIRKLEQNAFLQTATWLVSRRLTENAGPWNTSLLGDDDGEYFCRVLLGAESIRFVPESKVYYRASGASSLSYIGTSDRKLEAQLRSMELHIRYLQSLENSERVRAACVKYIQDWMVFFYPQRLDLVERLKAMAGQLGGSVAVPQLSWKYEWIRSLFGWPLANRAKIVLPGIKWSLLRTWDRTLLAFEARRLS